MKHITYQLSALAAMLLSLPLSTSCTSDDGGGTGGTGTSTPLNIVAQISGMSTRSTVTDSKWTKGDILTLLDGSTDPATAHKYMISDANNGAMSGDIFFGPAETEKSISAWSYGGVEYYGQLPSQASVTTDQSTGAKLQSADFLYAPVVSAEPSAAATLTFDHKMAKILIRVVKNTNTDADFANKTLTIGNVKIQSRNKASFTAGNGWTMADNTPFSTFLPMSATESGYLSTFTVLIIPQDMSGNDFLRFSATIDDTKEYFTYKPGATKANFEASKLYVFEVSFSYNKVVVKEVTAGWNEPQGGTVTDQAELVKTPDGTWTAATPCVATDETSTITAGDWKQTSGSAAGSQSENTNTGNGSWNNPGTGNVTEAGTTITVGGWTFQTGTAASGQSENTNTNTGSGWNNTGTNGTTNSQSGTASDTNWSSASTGSDPGGQSENTNTNTGSGWNNTGTNGTTNSQSNTASDANWGSASTGASPIDQSENTNTSANGWNNGGINGTTDNQTTNGSAGTWGTSTTGNTPGSQNEGSTTTASGWTPTANGTITETNN